MLQPQMVMWAEGIEVGNRVIIAGDNDGLTWTVSTIYKYPGGFYTAMILSEDLDAYEEVELDALRKL